MDDKDNIMIENFFKQAAQQQIEDNGFTERVMMSLPDTNAAMVRRLSLLWTLFCLLVAVILFFAFGGWQTLTNLFYNGLGYIFGWTEVMMVTAPTTEIPINPWVVVLLLAFVLFFLPYQIGRKLSATL